jgi:hypothetical protein
LKISQTSSGAWKYLAPVAGLVTQLNQPPGLQLLEPHAHIGAREFQRVGNLVCVQRFGRNEQQGIDLPHGAIDAPAAAHLAEMRNKLSAQLRQWFGLRHGLHCAFARGFQWGREIKPECNRSVFSCLAHEARSDMFRKTCNAVSKLLGIGAKSPSCFKSASYVACCRANSPCRRAAHGLRAAVI